MSRSLEFCSAAYYAVSSPGVFLENLRAHTSAQVKCEFETGQTLRENKCDSVEIPREWFDVNRVTLYLGKFNGSTDNEGTRTDNRYITKD